MDDSFATAKWANRMLRPLTSLHHRLGKYRELQTIDTAQRYPGRANNPAASSSSATTLQTFTKKVAGDRDATTSDHGDDHDPSWIPGESDKRRVKHKYVARGERLGRRARARPVVRSPEVVRTLPGAIEIATPLITGRTTYVAGHQCEEASGGDQAEMDPQLPTGKQGAAAAARTGRAPRQSRFPRLDTQWRASLDSAKDANYVDIVQRLDVLFLKFLEKTGLPDSRNPRSTGTSRSLLLTVMRRLPEFIAEEQRLQDELDDEDDVDMVDVYFTELESAYGSTAKGWQPLREAVRSQGIFLVCNMVQNSWITSYTASTLINKCIDAGENDAVESLLAAQLGKLEHYNYPDSFDPWRSAGSVRDPIRLLHKYWMQSRNHAYVYGQLEQLLSRRVLPTEWMVTTPWKACVVAATNSVSSRDREFAVGTELMEAVLKSAAGVSWTSNISGVFRTSRTMHADLEENSYIRRSQANGASSEKGRCPVYIQDALSNLVSSLVVALCGMCFVRMEQQTSLEDGSYARVANMLSSLALSTARQLSLEQAPEHDQPAEAQSLRRGYVSLGYCLLRCRQDPQFQDCDGKEAILNENCEPFFAFLEDKSEIIKELSVMVGQVVRCCERGEGAQCRRARRLCTQLLGVEQLGIPKLTLFLGKIAVEVALDFAQYSQDAEDHAYAGDIQDTVRAMRTRLTNNDVAPGMKQRRHPDTSMQSFRWEEGIGEWVAKTPLDRSKGAAAVSRVFAQPIVEIVRGSSPSSDSGEPVSSSPSSSLSIASTATSLSLKRTRVDEDESYYCPSIKRPRRVSTNRRQSARIAVQRDVVNDTEDEESDQELEEDDADNLSSGSESEDELSYGASYTRRLPRESQTTNRISVQASPQAKGIGFEIVIYNNFTAPIAAPSSPSPPPPTPKRRGRGRPPKQQSRRVSMQPRRSLRPSLVIPCSEDEESDDELSFLN